MATQDAKQDGNNFPGILIHTGTAGTAELIKATGQASGAQNIHVMGGTVVSSATLELNSGTVTTIQNGTQQTLGTVGVVNNGSIVVTNGTVTANSIGTIGVVNAGSVVVTAGTIGDLDTVGTVGVVNTGTLAQITSVSNLVTGTLASTGTVGVVNNGSIVVKVGTAVGADAAGGTSTTRPVQIGGTNSTGTVYGMLVDDNGNPQVDIVNAPSITNLAGGTVNRVEGGSIVMTAGTVSTLNTVGTVGVVNAGSVVMTAGTVSVLNTVGTVGVVNAGSFVQTAGTLTTGSIIVTAGSTVQTAGTLTTGTLQNLVSGTINALAAGTITTGTVRVNNRPTISNTTFGTLGTAGGSLFATLSAASGAGTTHIISGLSIVVQSGTPDVRILVGSAITGASVLAAGAFQPGGGIARDFTEPIETGTNTELLYHFVNAGTAFITVQFKKGT